jgi:2-keto-3-deoxy-L-rhamnonate aldolase RhmA
MVADSGVDRAMHEAVVAIAATGVSPIVRIPDMQSWMIKRKHCPIHRSCEVCNVLIPIQVHSTVAPME